MTEAASSAQPASAGLTFGPRLKAARESLGLSVNDVAARLRLQPRQVIAIERENLEALPGAAFVRGFVRNYAKEVRLDAAVLIVEVNRVLEPAAVAAASPGQTVSPVVGTAERERWSRPLVIALALGALIVFGAVGWWSTVRTRTAPPAAVSFPAPAPASRVAEKPVATAPAEGTSAPARAGAAEQVDAHAAASPPSAVASPAAESSPAAAAPSSPPNTLRLNFREASWVEVVQSDGTMLLSQNNEAGSEQILRGKPPYRVVIGNASGVGVEFEGKPIDLRPVTTAGNVARFTLPGVAQ